MAYNKEIIKKAKYYAVKLNKTDYQIAKEMNLDFGTVVRWRKKYKWNEIIKKNLNNDLTIIDNKIIANEELNKQLDEDISSKVKSITNKLLVLVGKNSLLSNKLLDDKITKIIKENRIDDLTPSELSYIAKNQTELFIKLLEKTGLVKLDNQAVINIDKQMNINIDGTDVNLKELSSNEINELINKINK